MNLARYLLDCLVRNKSVQHLETLIAVQLVKKYSIFYGNRMLRFQVFTAASMKMAVFWVVAPCSLVDVYLRFRGTRCLHHQGEVYRRFRGACDRPENGGSKHL
jgi:hypothetical protein